MSLTIAGYNIIEVLYEKSDIVVYRGVQELDHSSVIIKTLKSEYPKLQELSRLKHEYQLLSPLDIAGILKPYTLENYQHGLALILSDFAGKPLASFINTEYLNLNNILQIVIQLADTLAELHQQQIIHKDINPYNILINSDTKVKIINFSIASQLSRENPSLSHPNQLEGTLAYMSPEQTGRMNRLIDYRTDLYSLGVTFYEMLTGQLPFQSSDPLELVHCHIAKTPTPPSELNSQIPLIVSDIVLKLLSKTAEDRYQTALGLKADLEVCLKMLQSGNISYFPIGKLDKSSQFLIPQKLYGRETEVATLINAFVRVASPQEKRVGLGATEMILVSGYSGIGKSALVNEIHKPIVGKRGYFISGKFDQFKRNIPYSVLIQAFQELIRQLLTETTEKIALWKSKLIEALGANGQVIIDIIPEVELILDEQPKVSQLAPAEAQNRFNRVFKQFIHVFCQAEHPLVIFMDDLQWADLASLKLIELLITDNDSQYLLLIGAYRDNEVEATHPLMLTLEDIKQTGAVVNNIVLKPLNITHVNQLVGDTLISEQENTKQLAELVFNKTQGNPFFLTQLLKSLDQDNLLWFDFSTKTWQWDIERLQNIDITDNVVDLMVNQIQRLAPETINILKIAACIGDKFTLDILSIVNKTSLSETAIDLWSALQAGLILPLYQSCNIPLLLDVSNTKIREGELVTNIETLPTISVDSSLSAITYKFLHDRVQQAAYSLIPDVDKKQTHLKVGEMLLKHTPEAEIEDNIFEIVNHLNIGVELINQQPQKDELAKLNLRAGKKAKAATAYEPAVKYLSIGLELLPESKWESQYDLTLDLSVETTAAAYLSTNFEQAKILSEVVLNNGKNLLDKIKIYEIQMQFHIQQHQMQPALEIGLQALQMLEISLVQERPRELNEEELAALPEMINFHKLAAMRILMNLCAPTYVLDPILNQRVALTMVALCSQYGTSPIAAFGYGLYDLMLCGLRDIDAGYRAGKLALRLLDKFNANELRAKIYGLFYAHASVWKEHLKKTLAPLLNGIQSGLETGDIEWAGYNTFYYCDHLLFIGEPLEVVAQKQAQYFESMLKRKQTLQSYYLNIWRRLVLKLLNKAEERYSFQDAVVTDAEILQDLIAAQNHMFTFASYLANAILFYFLRDYEQSIANASAAVIHAGGVFGMMINAQHNFYYSLALLAQASNLSVIEQKAALLQVNLNQEVMKEWAFHAPANYQHKYDLVGAENARVLGQFLEAMELYDRAIAGAKENGFIHEEALANELAAEFYFSRNRDKVARDYLSDSYYSYVRWGAAIKVKQLEETYPDIFSKRSENTISQTTNNTSHHYETLDLATVMKASQALSGEIVLNNLLTKLMDIAMENAGAQTGFLILEKAGELVIESAGGLDSHLHLQQSKPRSISEYLPISLVNYVARINESVVLNNATQEGLFTSDPYIINHKPKSILCTPILHQGKLTGILYLENNLTIGAFTPDRLEVLQLLSSQAAISIENARLYFDLAEANRTLETKVAERTLELQQEIIVRQLAEEAAGSANRAKSEFLANMSHELRTPLNGILGYAQILKKSKTILEKDRDGVGIIHQCSEHLLTLINDILDLSKIESRKMELNPSDFHFPAFLESIAEICRIRAEQKGIKLIYEVATPLPKAIRADEQRLRQVLINLLGNAVKFTEQGSVNFKVKVIGKTSLNTGEDLPLTKIRFQIEDTGVGIAPQQLEEVFLAFQQVGEQKRQTEGTGLGLAISRQLVQLMCGEIQVNSTLGEGSVFFFDLDLPETVLNTDFTNLTHRNIVGFKGNKRQIMVVDDKSSNRSVLVNLLEPLGFELVEATNGSEAIKKASEVKPDCILMDLVMPVMDGFEATRRIRQLPELKDIVILATSASVFNFDRQQSREVGCNDFISKPIQEKELLKRLKTYLNLSWIYEESQVIVQESSIQQSTLNDSLITPPPEEVAMLLELAMRGDLRGISKRTTYIESLGQEFIPFATHLRQLAKAFKGKQILDFLNQSK